MLEHRTQKSLWLAETGIFVFIWLIIFASPLLFQSNQDQINWQSIFTNWIRLLPFMALMCLNHFLLVPYVFFRYNKLFYLFSALTLIFAFSIFLNNLDAEKPGPPGFNPERELRNDFPGRRPEPMHQFQGQERPPRHLNPPPGERRAALPPYINTFLIAFLIMGSDTGLRVVFKWFTLEKERNILEKEKVQTELAFLRNQISPHFFMNTLNNIHALIDIDSEDAKDSVIKLSKLMRHLLYDSNVEITSLVKEIEFIKNYIDLMRLRFTDKVQIRLSFPEVIPDIGIPPMLFTSLLENAFKHGVSYRTNSFVELIIRTHENHLYFRIINSKTNGSTIREEGGIGLENLQKRLDLLYAKRYELVQKDEKETFEIQIKLPIDERSVEARNTIVNS